MNDWRIDDRGRRVFAVLPIMRSADQCAERALRGKAGLFARLEAHGVSDRQAARIIEVSAQSFGRWRCRGRWPRYDDVARALALVADLDAGTVRPREVFDVEAGDELHGGDDGGGDRGAACMVRRRSSQAATRDLRRGRRRAPERRPAAGRPFVLSRVTAPRPRRCRKSGRRRWRRPSAPCTSSMVTGRRDARMLLRSEAATRGNTVEAAVEVSRYSSPCRRLAVVFRRRRPRPARPCGPGRMRGMDSVRGCTDKHRRPAASLARR